MPIPEKGNETSLTGWLFYRTGTVITTYEKAFFVLEEGYLYLYNQPKRSAASDKGSFLRLLDVHPLRSFDRSSS
jgi:hypothetical protein